MTTTDIKHRFDASLRPHVALITNHGYGGAAVPMGGAPDTGGQNMYVNALARALDRQGYNVTVFARGGFPHFESRRIRDEPEFLTDHVRYIFIPGGGDRFIRKEDIAIALDEEVAHLDTFIREEARRKNCAPWEVHEFINTHYWDAAVLGVGLVERWRNDVAAQWLTRMLEGTANEATLERLHERRHRRSLGIATAYQLGRLLVEWDELTGDTPEQRAHEAAARWSAAHGFEPGDEAALHASIDEATALTRELHAPTLAPAAVAEVLGRAILAHMPDEIETLNADLRRVDRHVWTPHSLGELKDENFRKRTMEERRSLKFCERRSHERMVCNQTRAFASTSAEIAERLWTHYGVHLDQTFYFPPCVDTETFCPYDDGETEPTYRYLSEVSGVPVEQLQAGRIVFETSRMDRTKRKDLVIAAFARVASACPDTFLFIGGGPENDIFQVLNEQLDVNDALMGRAFLTRPIPEEHIGPMFSIADVFVTASEMEGFGMTSSQAAAAGTAIVSSDLTPFSVHHAGDQALIFRAGDARACAEAIRLLLENDDERQRRATELRVIVEPLNWDNMTARFITHLRRHGIDVADGIKDA